MMMTMLSRTTSLSLLRTRSAAAQSHAPLLEGALQSTWGITRGMPTGAFGLPLTPN